MRRALAHLTPLPDSTKSGVNRTRWVNSPPSYEKGRNYPVLYLLHAGGDIEYGWTMIGRADPVAARSGGNAKPVVSNSDLVKKRLSHYAISSS